MTVTFQPLISGDRAALNGFAERARTTVADVEARAVAAEPESIEAAQIATPLGEGSEDSLLAAEEYRWREQLSEVTGHHWPAVTNVVVRVGSDTLELLPEQALDTASDFTDFGIDLAAFSQRAATGWDLTGPAPKLDIEAAGITAVRQIVRKVCKDAAEGDQVPLPVVRVGAVQDQLLTTVIESGAEVSAACQTAQGKNPDRASEAFFAASVCVIAEAFEHAVAEARAAGGDVAAEVKHMKAALDALVRITAEQVLNPEDADG